MKKKKILEKKNIKVNDVIVAIPSSGLHSNGFSLVRHVISNKKIKIKKNKQLRKWLLEPTKIYVKEITKLKTKAKIYSLMNYSS